MHTTSPPEAPTSARGVIANWQVLPEETQTGIRTLFAQVRALRPERAAWIAHALSHSGDEQRETWARINEMRWEPATLVIWDELVEALRREVYHAFAPTPEMESAHRGVSGAGALRAVGAWILHTHVPEDAAIILDPWILGNAAADWAEEAPGDIVEIASALLPGWTGTCAELIEAAGRLAPGRHRALGII